MMTAKSRGCIGRRGRYGWQSCFNAGAYKAVEKEKKKSMEKIRWKRDGKRMEKEEAWSTENGRVETQAASFDRNGLAAKALSPSFLT